MADTLPDEGNHMVKHDNDCLNALSLSILSHQDLSAAAMKMIPSCRHHELVLIAAYLLRGDQHLDERKKLAQLITGNPTNEKENESKVARDKSASKNGNGKNEESAGKKENGKNVQHGKDTGTNGNQEGIVVQKLLTRNNTQPSSQVESTPKAEANPATGSRILLWENQFQKLLKYKSEHGHFKIPPSHKSLRNWVRTMQRLWRENRIPEHRLKRLQAVGFFEGVARNRDEKWEKRFADLVEFKARHGHCDVPQRYPNNPPLGLWAGFQRKMHTMQNLAEERVQRLEALGFRLINRDVSNDLIQQSPSGDKHSNVGVRNNIIHDKKWEKHFADLLEFKANHGHCNVPWRYPNNPQLGRWAGFQRKMHTMRNLREDRAQRLEALGFRLINRNARNDAIQHAQHSGKNRHKKESTLHDKKWEKHFAELIEFKARHGHCEVPQRYSNNPQLGHWAMVQRQLHSKQNLSENRIQRLEALGFRLTTLAARKSDKATQQSQSSNRDSNACDNIRMARSHEAVKLHCPTKKQSNTNCDQTWDMMYEQLIEYQDIHGNVDVPENYEENVILSHWVDEVRKVYRRGELREDQVRGLNEIGFSWNVGTFPKMNVMEPISTISADIENETL